MSTNEVLSILNREGIRTEVLPDGNLRLTPRSKLTPEIRALVRGCKTDIVAALTKPDPELMPPAENSDQVDVAGGDDVQHYPDNNLRDVPEESGSIDPGIAAQIQMNEAFALRAGWTHDLLWNSQFWAKPRGLAAVMDRGDRIAVIDPSYIEIEKADTARSRQRFYK
jgi:hypothetical protein